MTSKTETTTRLIEFVANDGQTCIERVSNRLAAVLFNRGLAVDPVIYEGDQA